MLQFISSSSFFVVVVFKFTHHFLSCSFVFFFLFFFLPPPPCGWVDGVQESRAQLLERGEHQRGEQERRVDVEGKVN